MKIEKLRELSEVELTNEISKLKKELFNLRFQYTTGQLENPIKLRDLRKDIARAKTVLREKEMKRA